MKYINKGEHSSPTPSTPNTLGYLISSKQRSFYTVLIYFLFQLCILSSYFRIWLHMVANGTELMQFLKKKKKRLLASRF